MDQRITFSHDRKGLEFTTSFTPSLTLTLEASTGTGINLVPPPGARPSPAGLSELRVTSEVRPSARLNLATSYLLTRLRNPDGAHIFSDHILRARVNYQFTRTLSARAIVQYDDLAAAPAMTSLPARRNLNLDLLFTYLRTPGSALYVGYNNNLEYLDPSLRLGPNGLLRTPRGLRSDGWQLFVKASYLLRK